MHQFIQTDLSNLTTILLFKKVLFFFFSFLLSSFFQKIILCKGLNSHYKTWSYKKRSPKCIKHTGNLFRKNLQVKGVFLDLKPLYIIGQRKAFFRQSVLESSCARKETVDIDILVTSRNGDRNFMQSIRKISKPPSRIRKWNQLSQFR